MSEKLLVERRDHIVTLTLNQPETVAESFRSGIQRIPLALWNLEVPVIAAVNGPAYGAGCDLALMCDIRIASDRAVFAENFVKLGIMPDDGGAWLLPRHIGLSRAAEMSQFSLVNRGNYQQRVEAPDRLQCDRGDRFALHR